MTTTVNTITREQLESAARNAAANKALEFALQNKLEDGLAYVEAAAAVYFGIEEALKGSQNTEGPWTVNEYLTAARVSAIEACKEVRVRTLAETGSEETATKFYNRSFALTAEMSSLTLLELYNDGLISREEVMEVGGLV